MGFDSDLIGHTVGEEVRATHQFFTAEGAKAATREGAYFKYTPWADGVAGTPVIVDTKAALK